MEKSILIIGRQCSGKTTKAREIASQFNDDEVVFIHHHFNELNGSPFLFSNCTEKTKLIVVDELSDISHVEEFYYLIDKSIVVHKQMRKPFTIEPKFILICATDVTDEELKEFGTGFRRRFDVVKCEYGR